MIHKNLTGYPINNLLEGWYFRVKEISPGYYRVEGIDRLGHSVARDGVDPNRLLSELKDDISEMFLNDITEESTTL